MPFLKPQTFKETHSQKLERISRINGLRKAIFSTKNDKYIGEWKDNIKEGKGQYISRTGKLYEGDWERGYRHGFGIQCQRDDKKIFRIIFSGHWKNGKYSGEGHYHYPDGSVYFGNFWKGLRHGYGQMWYAEGSFYDGDWYKDKRDGTGLFVYHNGNRYEGNWKDDMKSGKGRFFHLITGQLQEGVWRFDSCIFSTFIDIPFRQSASDPTYYPIRKNELDRLDEVCEIREMRLLENYVESCLSLKSIDEERHEESNIAVSAVNRMLSASATRTEQDTDDDKTTEYTAEES